MYSYSNNELSSLNFPLNSVPTSLAVVSGTLYASAYSYLANSTAFFYNLYSYGNGSWTPDTSFNAFIHEYDIMVGNMSSLVGYNNTLYITGSTVESGGAIYWNESGTWSVNAGVFTGIPAIPVTTMTVDPVNNVPYAASLNQVFKQSTSGTWTQIGRNLGNCTISSLLIESGVLYAGGCDNTESIGGQIYQYNGVESWSKMSNTPLGQFGITSLAVNNEILYAGGNIVDESSDINAEVYQYMGNNIWNPTGLSSVAQGISGSNVTSMTVSNGILCAGGYTTNESGTGIGQVWQYNSSSSTWNILIESGINEIVDSLIAQ